jgi:hypothetical protein
LHVPLVGMRWIVRRISRIRTDARDRELATLDIPDVRKFEQRALGAGESVKLRYCEVDEWRVKRAGDVTTSCNCGIA